MHCGCGYFDNHLAEMTSNKWNEYVTITVEPQFKQLQSSPKKSFFGLKRDSNPYWPLRSRCSAVPAELWRPIGRPIIEFWPASSVIGQLAYLQCMGLHSSAGRALQRERRGHGFESSWSPKKLLFFLANLQLHKLQFNCKGFICIPAVHIISFCTSNKEKRFQKPILLLQHSIMLSTKVFIFFSALHFLVLINR